MNHAPEILFPTEPSPQELVLQDLTTVLSVIAVDDDGDALLFAWTGVPSDVEQPPVTQPTEDPPGYVSWYVVPYDERMAGRTVTVTVIDGSATATYSWHVELVN